MGRGLDVTVQLVSKKNPLMLSRKHAILKQTDDGEYWTVRDNKVANTKGLDSSTDLTFIHYT